MVPKADFVLSTEPVVTDSWVQDNVHPNLQAGGTIGYTQRQDPAAYAAFDAARAGRTGASGRPSPPTAT